MKIKEVRVSFRFKKNLGNYQTADYEAETMATVDENEDENMVYEKLWTLAKNQVRREIGKPVEQ